MAMRYLGEEFDVHTGGIDNVFPHHEDEIAQSAAITGRPPARMWVHGEFLLMDGRKMAKSAGNFQRITEIGEGALDPLAFRYLALTARYRHKLEYSDASLAGAGAALESLRARLRALGPPPADGRWAPPVPLRAGATGERPVGVVPGVAGHGAGNESWSTSDRTHGPAEGLSVAGARLHRRFVDALDDDLDLPTALATVREVLKADLPVDERRWLVLDADAVLGLDLHRSWEAAADQQAAPTLSEVGAGLIAERASARAAHDFERADALRAELHALGIEVIDRADGSTSWRPVATG
jgi:cysteinyl-tRNA synthetase